MKKCAHCKTTPTTRKYCSNACSQAAYRERKWERMNEERVREGLQPFPFERACACGCGVMMPIENEQSDKRLLYWTEACRQRAYRASKRIVKTCHLSGCNNPAKRKFCSDKCKAKAYRMRKRDKKRAQKHRLDEIYWKLEGDKRVWFYDYREARLEQDKVRCADLLRQAYSKFGDYWTSTYERKVEEILA